MSRRLKRRTWKQRLGERIPFKKLFPKEIKKEKVLVKARRKIEERISKQPEIQIIVGKIREKKVLDALRSLQKKGEIHGFVATGNLSYADSIKGVDFFFVHVTPDSYKICPFSITGWRWIKQHEARYPEVPVFPVEIWEDGESIEEKILRLKNSHS